ncbi:ATP-binding protein [Streptomyces sp. NPDC017868]|uniref:ATP-binding protein n=1 Tax=Streptomyces sp. NPDC017868 TaxID=3365014 RepID=UPI0037A5BB9E
MVRALAPCGTAALGRNPHTGRGREPDRLLDTVRRPPAVVLVEGEAAAGKSRLVAEVAAVPCTEGRPVLAGLCHPLREPFPYGPPADALDKAAAWLGDTALPPAAAPLVRPLPALADRLPRASAGAGQRRTGPPELLVAARALLRVLGPTGLVVEDLQGADDASRDLLLLLARDLPEQPSLVLTHRTEDLPPGRFPLDPACRHPPGAVGAARPGGRRAATARRARTPRPARSGLGADRGALPARCRDRRAAAVLGGPADEHVPATAPRPGLPAARRRARLRRRAGVAEHRPPVRRRPCRRTRRVRPGPRGPARGGSRPRRAARATATGPLRASGR